MVRQIGFFHLLTPLELALIDVHRPGDIQAACLSSNWAGSVHLAFGAGVVGWEFVGAIEMEGAATRFGMLGLGAKNVVHFLGSHSSIGTCHSGGDTEFAVSENVALEE